MRRRACSISEHGRIAGDRGRFEAECSNHRPWPEFGLVIAEHACGSTLSVETDRVEEGMDRAST